MRCTARAWQARIVLAGTIGLTLLGMRTATGQLPDSTAYRGSPALLKYGKWVSLAGTIAMGIAAADAHRSADRSFGQLRQYCFADHARCAQSASGSYLDPLAEGYYQRSLVADRRARRWLVGGELALIGTVGLFVWELSRPSHPPGNIPFEPTASFTPEATRFGLRATF
jgi:hypothetical protein